jgi:outer membrane receptor protein involved in Fe transport
MLKFLFVFIILINSFFAVSGQRPDSGGRQVLAGTISGVLVDSITRLPIAYAAIGLIESGSRQVVNGTMTDENGNFRIPDVPAGQYQVEINFIGYKSLTIPGIKLTSRDADHALGTILLGPEAQLLEEIKIVGEAALIEARPDKIVYNAEHDVTSRGGDAADVLRKVPLLNVDFDGNVMLRGSENVQVLINGRPSSIFNSNLADALKMMPADQIKAVEVITAPSAKYDGEGTAGIINIITRKKNVEGFTSSGDLTGGSRSSRGNMNFNYGRGRLGLNLSGGGWLAWPQTGVTEFYREEFGDAYTSLLSQGGKNESSHVGLRTHAGLEYNFNPASTLNASFSVRGHRRKSQRDVTASYLYNEAVVEDYFRSSDDLSRRTGWEWELDYKKLFPQEDHEWSISAELDYDDEKQEADYFQTYTLPVETPDDTEHNFNVEDNIELSVQTDYVHPVRKNIKLETGLKAEIEDLKSDFEFEYIDPDQQIWRLDEDQTDIFFYNQQVYAGYLSSTFELGERYTLIGGVRLEVTHLQGEFADVEIPFSNQYNSWLPNLTISKKSGEHNQLKVSYNQRIQRPGDRHINPFIEYNDNRDISYGNPGLHPEKIHQVELGTNIFLEKNMISVSLFGRRTEDLIEQLLHIDETGVSETTYENFGRRHSLGLNVFGSVNLGDLTLRGGFDINAWDVSGEFENENLSNSGYDYNGRINITWVVSETFRMEGFSFFRSPSYTVQGRNPNWSMMSFAMKKDFFDKRLTIGLNITEPFRENLQFIRELEGPGFYQYSNTLRPVRSYGINLGYRIGKIESRERNPRRMQQEPEIREEEPNQDIRY